jgi:hypothetical protein
VVNRQMIGAAQERVLHLTGHQRTSDCDPRRCDAVSTCTRVCVRMDSRLPGRPL